MYPAGSDMLLVSIKKLFVVGHGCYNVFGTGSRSPCSMNIFNMGFFMFNGYRTAKRVFSPRIYYLLNKKFPKETTNDFSLNLLNSVRAAILKYKNHPKINVVRRKVSIFLFNISFDQTCKKSKS